MPFAHLPALLPAWFADLAAALDRRSAPRLLLLLCGAPFAKGRRTATSWFRAAGITAGFRRAYSALWAAGRRAEALAHRLLGAALKPLMRRAEGDRLLFAIGGTPAARYGPCAEGAGVHHNPTPGPAGEKLVYGHVWVTLAWLPRHPAWDALALPPRALSYASAQDVPALAKHYPWEFRTKRELAAELARWLTVWVGGLGRVLWLAVDGAYAKRPFLKPVLALGVVVVSRLRRPGQRGPSPTYGRGRIDLARRAGQRRGWQEGECVQYGERAAKAVKTFLATWRPAGGAIRVVIVREGHDWLAYSCADPAATAAQVLGAMADRAAIEQASHDVKAVGGAGQQQVRNAYASAGAFAVNLLLYSAVEARAWARGQEELVDRPAWDGEGRRPSHADKRRALQREA